MADKRKLLGEMERCFKKIQEGVETFADIWNKLHSANNTNQKDKYESDLKKEIKKLQRLRDQIKTWAASNEIKDKDTLLQYRRLIEQQMEKFKVVERETKTKAYSKEGLGAAAKVDPAQKEKEETEQWLQTMIGELNLKLDMAESEIETMTSGSRKKKIDRDKQDRIEDLKSVAHTHRFHIQNLECLLRMLDNETITSEKINLIRDDLEYYLEACDDPDYEHNEFLYTDMGLDESEVAGSVTAVTATASSPTDNHTSAQASDDTAAEAAKSEQPKDEESTRGKRGSKSDTDQSASLTPRKSSISSQAQTPQRAARPSPATSNKTPSKVAPSATVVPPSQPPLHMVGQYLNQPYAAAAAAGQQQQPKSNHVQITTENFLPPKQTEEATTRNMWHTGNHITMTTTATDSNQVDIRNTMNSIVSSVESMTIVNPAKKSIPQQQQTTVNEQTPTSVINNSNNLNGGGSAALMMNNQQNMTSQQQSMFDHKQQQVIQAPPVDQHNIQQNFDGRGGAGGQAASDLLSSVVQDGNQQQQMSESRITPLQGVAPLGIVSATKENQWQKVHGDSCYRHMPHPSDSERQRHYLPRNPCLTPVYYPQSPLPHHDTLEFYLRLSTESLFFIFYYMEASKAQYMAAKALKKQSWRFHTKYMMWFQRHEEPKTITDEFEQGTYIYFDYEKWGQRKKEGFTFEYRFLEDRELQ